MTRKLQNTNLDNAKSGKRILKPVIEKKRRDRINQSLGELRTLLLNYTSDVRLQNPKIEKAEILDLAVEYLQKWTDRKSMSNDSTNGNYGQMKDQYAPMVNLPHSSESSSPTLFTIENAGFQQCMAQLASYMHKITPAQRVSLIQELRSHTESQCNSKPGQHSSSSTTDFNQRTTEAQMAKGPDTAASDEVVRNSKRKKESPKFILLSHHSSCQPGTLSPSICHDYLSPPISPYLSSSSSSSSAYATPPPFPSLACHFSFPPSLSPLSSNTSFSTPSQSLPTMPAPVSFSPTHPLSASPTLHFPSLTTLRSPVPAPREGLPANSSSSIWRPWF